jgi:hypothetical protein
VVVFIVLASYEVVHSIEASKPLGILKTVLIAGGTGLLVLGIFGVLAVTDSIRPTKRVSPRSVAWPALGVVAGFAAGPLIGRASRGWELFAIALLTSLGASIALIVAPVQLKGRRSGH